MIIYINSTIFSPQRLTSLHIKTKGDVYTPNEGIFHTKLIYDILKVNLFTQYFYTTF